MILAGAAYYIAAPPDENDNQVGLMPWPTVTLWPTDTPRPPPPTETATPIQRVPNADSTPLSGSSARIEQLTKRKVLAKGAYDIQCKTGGATLWAPNKSNGFSSNIVGAEHGDVIEPNGDCTIQRMPESPGIGMFHSQRMGGIGGEHLPEGMYEVHCPAEAYVAVQHSPQSITTATSGTVFIGKGQLFSHDGCGLSSQ